MKAYVVDAYRKASQLRLAEVPEPAVEPNDVLVEVHATSLNLLDSKIRDGEFKPILPYKPPFVAGHDVAGKVVRVGSAVRRFKMGDEVYALLRDGRIGTFAEFIAIDAADVALKPRNLSFEDAASIPLVGLTAWQALVERANLRAGQKVLIQAGVRAGVGSFAIQLARHLGVMVATTTGAANADLVRQLGAQVVIDYRKDDFEKLLEGYDSRPNSQDNATLENLCASCARVVRSSPFPVPRIRPLPGTSGSIPFSAGVPSAQPKDPASRTEGRHPLFVPVHEGNGAQLARITELIEAGVIRRGPSIVCSRSVR